jgi:hypothetical protein
MGKAIFSAIPLKLRRCSGYRWQLNPTSRQSKSGTSGAPSPGLGSKAPLAEGVPRGTTCLHVARSWRLARCSKRPSRLRTGLDALLHRPQAVCHHLKLWRTAGWIQSQTDETFVVVEGQLRIDSGDVAVTWGQARCVSSRALRAPR